VVDAADRLEAGGVSDGVSDGVSTRDRGDPASTEELTDAVVARIAAGRPSSTPTGKETHPS